MLLRDILPLRRRGWPHAVQLLMSPKKLAATLAAILRDFEPWKDSDRDHQWGGPQVGLLR